MATYAVVELPSIDETRVLVDYTSIQFDLLSAREFAKRYLDEMQKTGSNYDLLEPLMVAAIIRYARPFATGVRQKLNPDDLLKPGQLEQHQYLRDVRDKFIAYSVNQFEQSRPSARYCVETVKEEGITSIECSHIRVAGLSGKDVNDIVELTTSWLEYVDKKLQEEKARLLPIIRKMPLEEVLKGVGPAVLDTSRPNRRR